MSHNLISAKAQAITTLCLDVDGVLTDGSFLLGADGQEMKKFHTQDGLGLKLLQKQGVKIAIISSRASQTVALRMQELGITQVYQGVQRKMDAFNQLLQQLSLEPQQIAYMGDDLPDLECIERAGLGIAPANAVTLIRQRADWITTRCGGDAAVREVCDFILFAQECHQTL